MRRSLSVFLLLMYVVSFTEFHQALRLPLLVEHYQEHRAMAGELSFWDFLVLHYKTDVAHDDRDMRLPFKDCGHSLSTFSIALLSAAFTIQPSEALTSSDHQSFYISHMPPLRAGDIFQPPKA